MKYTIEGKEIEKDGSVVVRIKSNITGIALMPDCVAVMQDRRLPHHVSLLRV